MKPSCFTYIYSAKIKTRLIYMGLELALFILFGTPWAISQSFDQWRYWTISDGLEETWSSSISIGPTGKVWVNHGDVTYLSCLDGYHIFSYPSPALSAKVLESDRETLWSLREGAILRLKEGSWISYPIDGITTREVPFIPTFNDNILVLLADRLLFLVKESGEVSTLKSVQDTTLGQFNHITKTSHSEYVITGENGIAVFSLEEEQIERWRDFSMPHPLYVDYQNPWYDGENGVYIAATNKMTDFDALLYFFNGQWKELYESKRDDLKQGWRNAAGSIWIQWGDNSLTQIYPNGEKQHYREELLSGAVYDLAIDTDGSFWLATSQGVVRYAPSIWSTPRAISDIKNTVNFVYKDSNDSLWFDCTDLLLHFRNNEWARYPYPSPIVSQYNETGTLCPLPDGRIAIRSLHSTFRLLIFNPHTREFEYLSHPDNLSFGFMCPTKNGDVWIQIGENFSNPKSMSYRLDKYDGEKFNTVLDRGGDWSLGYLRAVLETDDGTLWLGGTKGLARYTHGDYQLITEEDGFTENAAFALFEHANGEIWVGGRNSILSYDDGGWKTLLNHTDQIRSFNHFENNNIWIATVDGLYREFMDSWIKNSKAEGLTSSLINNVVRDEDGDIWVATSSGISQYNPEADRDTPDTIISIDKNLRRFAPGEDVHLLYEGMDKWKQTSAGWLYYSYRLDNSAWSQFTSGTVSSFSDLGAGTHDFEVRTVDRNLNVDPSPAQFQFTVLPHWYQESMFLVIVSFSTVTIIILLSLAGHHYWIREKMHSHIIKQSHELELANEELKRLSYVDGLTGVSNRRRFDEQLEQEWRRSLRDLHPIALIMIDVDFFKKYNDLYGHQSGDECLRLIAKTIQCSIRRAGDLVARYGGEEFIVLLVNTPLDKAQLVAEKIRKHVEQLEICHEDSKCSMVVTISEGVASAVPIMESSANRLVELADQALYQAKQHGRNRIYLSEMEL